MSSKTHLLSGLLGLGLLLCVNSAWAQWSAYRVTDVIPFSMSAEFEPNREPSIAASPCTSPGPNLGILISTFDNGSPHPFFGSGNGGTIYANVMDLTHGDVTLEWNGNASSPVAYLVRLYEVSESVSTMEVRKSATPICLGNPLDKAFVLMTDSAYSSSIPDQPWLEVATVGDVDRIYVGFNDTGASTFPRRGGKTAKVRYSVNGGISWNNVVIEKAETGVGRDSPAVRVAAAKDGQTVYALFQRWNAKANTSGAGNFKFRNYEGDIVVVKEATGGAATLNFNALPLVGPTTGQGTLVRNGIVLPWTPVNPKTGSLGGAALGNERIGGDCSIAVDPNDANLVYVAYTEVCDSSPTSPGTPYVRVHRSTDGGGTFGDYIYTTKRPSALPALAVAKYRTVGLLLTELNGVYLETHFVQFAGGDFNSPFGSDAVLAMFPTGMPPQPMNCGKLGDQPCDPYIGDYQDLEAVGNRFFGVFCASNDPNPANFPFGVHYQRQFISFPFDTPYRDARVMVASELRNGAPGTGQRPVPISIDPFSFSTEATSPIIFLPLSVLVGRLLRIGWVERTGIQPPAPRYGLYASPTLGPSNSWQRVTNAVTVTNDQFQVEVPTTDPQRFFRLQKLPPSGTNSIETAAGAHGSLNPTGVVQVVAGQNLVLTAQPDAQYVVKQWWVDGAIAQSGGTNLTLTAVDDDHIVTATFIPPYDLAITLAGEQLVAVGANPVDTIIAANLGTLTAANVTVTHHLPAGLTATGGSSSQGNIVVTSNLVTCNLGTLAPDQSATLTIDFTATVSGVFSNHCTVSSPVAEVDPANNSAFLFTTALDPPVIVTQPHNATVAAGGTTNFTVVATGSPPLEYQWFFNGTNALIGEVNSTLTLTNVTLSQAGTYDVMVLNEVANQENFGPVRSDSAVLTVNPGVFQQPPGGWTYLYDGVWAIQTNLNVCKPNVTLDGTWSANNGSSEWDGSARGAGANNGAPGGIFSTDGILTIEDQDISTGGACNNRKIYFEHSMAQDAGATNASTIVDTGVTILFRARLTQPDIQPPAEIAVPNGWGIFSGGKGMFGVHQLNGAQHSQIAFSLVTTNTLSANGAVNYNFFSPGLTMNHNDSDAIGGSGTSSSDPMLNQVLPLDPNVFHEFWITIQANDATPGNGTHTVNIYVDGALMPATFNVTAGNGNDGETGANGNFIALGLNNSVGASAFDMDFFAYKQGVFPPGP